MSHVLASLSVNAFYTQKRFGKASELDPAFSGLRFTRYYFLSCLGRGLNLKEELVV